MTVSTSGLVPEIGRLGDDFGGNVGLAISLHAADDETRTRLMPINKKYPLAKLLDALRAYPLPRRRRITIEHRNVRVRPAQEKPVDAGEEKEVEHVAQRGTPSRQSDHAPSFADHFRRRTRLRNARQQIAPRGLFHCRGSDSQERRDIPNNCVAAGFSPLRAA